MGGDPHIMTDAWGVLEEEPLNQHPKFKSLLAYVIFMVIVLMLPRIVFKCCCHALHILLALYFLDSLWSVFAPGKIDQWCKAIMIT